MKRLAVLALFVVLVVGGGLVIGYFNVPGAWYGQLAKPVFNPPNWVFAPVWTVLYFLIAVAGWRVSDRVKGWPMVVWWLQLALNFLWSPTFFTAHQIGAAFLVILLLLAMIATFIEIVWPRDRVAAWLFVPYLAWVGFASLLNGAIYTLN
jgi:benzodiazapine receptor